MRQYILQKNNTQLVTYLPFKLKKGDIIKLRDVHGDWTVMSIGKENIINPYLQEDLFEFIDFKQIFGFSEYYLSDELTRKHFV